MPQTKQMYSYHNRIKQRISNNELIGFEYKQHKLTDGLQLVLMLYFNTDPYQRPIREHRFEQYKNIIT